MPYHIGERLAKKLISGDPHIVGEETDLRGPPYSMRKTDLK